MNDELKQFIMDLQEFAKNWVEEVNEVIVKHIDELFEDKSVRYLVKVYADESRKIQEDNKEFLFKAYYFNDGHIFKRHRIHDYTNVLYDLCYRRYRDEENKGENNENIKII